MDFDKMLDKIKKDREEAEQIKCPQCGYIYDEIEEINSFVTYWGDEIKEGSCPECGVRLRIEEIVERSFEVTLVQDEEK